MKDRQLTGQEADNGKQAKTELRPTAVPDKPLPSAIGNQAMQRWAAPRLVTSGETVQRQAANSADTAVPPTGITRLPLIVPDTTVDLQPGQMRRAEFLAQLQTAVCQAADETLAGTIYSPVGCPYIERWFAYYSRQDSTHIERAIQRFAPGAAQAASAQAVIPAITARVRQGIANWVETGQITGIPEGLTTELPVSQPTDLPPAVGPVQFKTEAGLDAAAPHPASVKARLKNGRSLDSVTRSRLGSAFGSDFSQVRIHTDGSAGQMAQTLRARAFTVGQDIAFAPGEYQPGSPIGDALLAHELAHVIQQSPSGGKQANHSPAQSGELENDADHTAVQAVVGLWQKSGAALKDIGRNALPRLKTGLRLQRCPVAAGVGAVGAGLYVILRPNIANAPGPGDKTYKSVSPLQVAGEAVAIFGVPGVVGAAMTRAGYGIVAVSGTTGAISSVGYRGVQDIAAGEFSGVSYYVADATTGALIGVVVGGVFSKFSGSPSTGSPRPDALYHHTAQASTIDDIAQSGRVWGYTEGRVYATELSELSTRAEKMRMGLMPNQELSGAVRFSDEAADMFMPHPVEGWYSGMKRAAGQYVSRRPGYDIVFDPQTAVRGGVIQAGRPAQSILDISQAGWARQSTGRFIWSHSRLWGRRILIDWGIPAVGAGTGIYIRQDLDTSPTSQRSLFSPWAPVADDGFNAGYGSQSSLGPSSMSFPTTDTFPETGQLFPGVPIIYVLPKGNATNMSLIGSDLPDPNAPDIPVVTGQSNVDTTGDVRLYIEPGKIVPLPQWGASDKNEWLIVNPDLPEGSVSGAICPATVPALTVDENGRIVPAK